MASKKPLRAVKDGEKAGRGAKFLTITEAAESGSRLDELVAMRRRIAMALDDPKTLARDLASLSRRQIEISKEVESLLMQEREEAEHGAVSEDEDWSQEAI